MQKVDMNTWSRKELYQFFSGMSQPFYSVTFTVDVTELYEYVKGEGISFYYALVGLCTRAVNRVEAFLYTIREGEVYRMERRSPSFTDLRKGSEQFYIVTMPCEGTIKEFCQKAREKSLAQTKFLDQAEETDDLIYFTCLPWVEMTALTNERHFDPDDNVPRISWGKYVEENGRKKLNLAVELNHRFLDGYHVGRFYEELSGMIRRREFL